MTSTEPNRRANDIRIDVLAEQVKEGFARMEGFLMGLDGRLRNVETQVAEFRGTQEMRLQAAENAQREFEKKLCELEGQLEAFQGKAEPWIAGIKWLALSIGALLVVFLVGIFTHQITLGFK